MKTHTLCITGLAFGLLGLAPFTINGQQPVRGHHAGLMAEVTLRDGETRVMKLEGVGCSQSICSRTAIKARAGTGSNVTTWLDDVASIQGTAADDALFVLKDGASHRMSLLTDFRVLYLANQKGKEKLDLASIQSVRFLP